VKIPLECLTREEKGNELFLLFGLPASHDVDATLELRSRAGRALEPDLWSLKKGDKVNITINPEGGFPPLEEKGAHA